MADFPLGNGCGRLGGGDILKEKHEDGAINKLFCWNPIKNAVYKV